MRVIRSFRAVTVAAVCGLALPPMLSAAEGPVLNVGGTETGGGEVKVTVQFEGRQARRRPIPMDQDAFCKEAHPADQPALAETFVFGDKLGEGDDAPAALQNVLVWVSKGAEGKTGEPIIKPVLDQHGCVYVPHVLPIMPGELKILNSDNTLHNVKMNSSNNGSFNEGMPVKGMELTKTLTKPEFTIPFKCDVHPWMNAYVHVIEHPYFAVTQQDGTVIIKGLPAGEYEISVRHEFDKFTPDQKSKTVTVAEGQQAELTFTYRPPGN